MLFNPIEPEHRWALHAGAAPVRSPAGSGHRLLLELFSPQSSAGTTASAKQHELKIHLRILI